jgi:PHS family inorganic phosphate transporter-like MFS transporter
MITGMLGIVYFQQALTNPGTLPSTADTGLKIATSAGTVIGQLAFGWLADVVGRKRMYGLELIIIIVGTLAQTISGSSVAVGVIGALIFWRVIMGIGIGGDYPLSAIITSEYRPP